MSGRVMKRCGISLCNLVCNFKGRVEMDYIEGIFTYRICPSEVVTSYRSN